MGSSWFPCEMMEEILIRLPVKSLMRFKCVCKRWCSLVHEPVFVQKHLMLQKHKEPQVLIVKNSYEPDKYYTIMRNDIILQWMVLDDKGDLVLQHNNRYVLCRHRETTARWTHSSPTCDGLICLFDQEGIVMVCNPSTREFKSLPRERSMVSNYLYYDTFHQAGFGFDGTSYKVVRFFSCPYELDMECEVFTLGAHKSKWRMIRTLPFTLSSRDRGGCFVNGALHWIRYTQMDPQRNMSEAIVAFDLREEKFRFIQHPKDYVGGNMFTTNLRGYLCIVDDVHVSNRIDIWMLKDYNKGIWVKEYCIDLASIAKYTRPRKFHGFIPIDITREGSITLYKNRGPLYSYHPNSRSFVIISKEAIKYGARPYIATLISPS